MIFPTVFIIIIGVVQLLQFCKLYVCFSSLS